MSRFLACRNIWRFGKLSPQNQTFSILVARNYENSITVRPPFSFCKLYSLCRLPARQFIAFACTSYKVKSRLSMPSYTSMLSIASASYSMTLEAQFSFRQLSHLCCYRSPSFVVIRRLAGSVSLACTRSHLIPSVIAFIFGELAWAEHASADAECLPVKDTLCMQAQDGCFIASSFVFSVIEGILLLGRATYLSVLFSPIIVMALFVDYCSPKFRKIWLQLVHLTLEKAGPAFIKWGQWAATRPDLFPRDLCTVLSKLHTQAPAHSFDYSKITIEKAFGRKLSEIFENFEEDPVASGSVAQVHRASLKYRYPGQKVKPITVAVKVRHPGVGESIRRDFTLINLVAKISKFLPTLKWLRLDESVQQFAVYMMSQVDLSREAAHLNRFIYNFRRSKDVSFPKPLYPFVHPAVLVETYEQGDSVAYYVDEFEGSDRIKRALAHIGSHALLKMLLVDNFIHADLHPGNILVRVSQTKPSGKVLFKSRPHVVFLDVGMTAELSKNERLNMIEFFKAVVHKDGRTIAQCTLRFSKQQKCPNPDAFIEETVKSFTYWGTPEAQHVHPAECIQELLEQVRRHKVNIDGSVCTVLITTLVLEGWQRKLDPDYGVLQTLQALLFKADWEQSLVYTIEGLMAP